MKMTHDLLQIVPSEIPRPTKHGKTYYAKGDFLYFHYCCDNYNDVVSENVVIKPFTISYMNASNFISFHFIDQKRDGAVHIEHCNQCAHGSQRIATQWMLIPIID